MIIVSGHFASDSFGDEKANCVGRGFVSRSGQMSRGDSTPSDSAAVDVRRSVRISCLLGLDLGLHCYARYVIR